MKEQIPVKDIETAEAIATKLTELGLGWGLVEYGSRFKPVEKGVIRKKKLAENIERSVKVSVLPDAKSLDEYKEIEKKLLTISPIWQKEPSYDGTWLYLKTKVGNVKVSVGISFPKDQIVSIMSQLLNCEIEEVKEQRTGYTTTSYVCKTKKETTKQ